MWLRGQECLTLESRTKSIPIPKSKDAAPKKTAAAKTRQQKPKGQDDEDTKEEPLVPKPKRGGVKTKK